MSDNQKTIYVYQSWDMDAPGLIGKLFVDKVKGKEHYAFEYDEAWLTSFGENMLILDPDLKLYRGRQYVPVDKKMFGIFADSCPDRWGRLLMRRREAIMAHKEGRKPKALTESDFLLGVYDDARMGALRFTTEENGPFLSDDKALATPPWVTLRELESASLSFEKDEALKISIEGESLSEEKSVEEEISVALLSALVDDLEIKKEGSLTRISFGMKN